MYWRKSKSKAGITEEPRKRVPLEQKKLGQLERLLDSEFSRYIRRKYSHDGMARCVTCGRLLPVSELDAGHYISRQVRALRWDERNVWPQCKYCNRFMDGRRVEFRAYLVQVLGEEEVKKMEFLELVHGHHRTPREVLIEKIKLYRKLNAELKEDV